MISERLKLRTNIFATLELDTNALTSQIVIVAPVGSQGRYKGVVTNRDGSSKEFSLVVQPSPAEPSATVDLSEEWVGIPAFNVVEKKGYVVVYVADDSSGLRKVRISNDTGVLFDNLKLTADLKVVLKLYRPGVHHVTDTTGGGVCEVTVSYPPPPTPWPTTPVAVKIVQITSTTTQMQPDKVSISPLQPLVFDTQAGTHLITELLAVTDREGQLFVTSLTEKGKRAKLRL